MKQEIKFWNGEIIEIDLSEIDANSHAFKVLTFKAFTHLLEYDVIPFSVSRFVIAKIKEDLENDLENGTLEMTYATHKDLIEQSITSS